MRRVLLWSPVIAGLTLSFWLSSVPGEDLSTPIPDYVAHMVQYLLLGLLVLRGFNRGMQKRPDARIMLWSVLFCLTWAMTDEFHQSFVPGRDAAVVDVLSDLVGAVAACGVFVVLRPLAPSWA